MLNPEMEKLAEKLYLFAGYVEWGGQPPFIKFYWFNLARHVQSLILEARIDEHKQWENKKWEVLTSTAKFPNTLDRIKDLTNQLEKLRKDV